MPRTVLRISAIACLGFATLARADEAAKPVRHPIARPSSTSPASGGSTGGSSLMIVGVAVALAAFGAFSLAARKARPGPDSAALRVVGRASLSPRQSVYLLRVGDRTLILGSGGQGPPSLLGELPAAEAAAPRLAVLESKVGGAA